MTVHDHYTGHLPDKLLVGYAGHKELVKACGAMSVIPPRASLEDLVDMVRDQNPAQSCCGQAMGSICHIRGLALGFKDMKPPSRLAPWTIARMKEKPLGARLENVGVMPLDAADAITTWGLCAEDVWPHEAHLFNVAPTPSVLAASADYRGSQFFAISDDPKERLDRIRYAIASSMPVALAVNVDNTFDSFVGQRAMPNYDGSARGTHYITVVGYDDFYRGAGLAFRILNSWGTGWGDNGFAWLSAERIANRLTFDVRAAEVVPFLEEP